MTTARRDYARAAAEVRGAWHASIGLTAEDDIRARSHCTQGVAFRVANLRRAGTLRPLGLWLDGVLTLRQVERIVSTAPFDECAQDAEAAAASPTARAMLLRT